VAEGIYHIVVKKEGYSWRVKYNASEGNHNFVLKKVIRWSGNYNISVIIPEDSFVEIKDNTTFSNGSSVTIGAGSIIEFKNNSKLEINGNFKALGIDGKEIYFVADDTSNGSRIKLNRGKEIEIINVNLIYVRKGMYITNSDSVIISKSRFKNSVYAIELFNCKSASVENNVISNMTDGIVSQETHLIFYKNIIINIEENGFKSLSAKNSIIKNNVFKNCILNGFGINVGGYSYTTTNLNITMNDFLNNGQHLFIGIETFCIANNNNFLNEKKFIINTAPSIKHDTLNFQRNYWGTIDSIKIANKIIDQMDRQNQERKGVMIDFSNYNLNYIYWQKFC